MIRWFSTRFLAWSFRAWSLIFTIFLFSFVTLSIFLLHLNVIIFLFLLTFILLTISWLSSLKIALRCVMTLLFPDINKFIIRWIFWFFLVRFSCSIFDLLFGFSIFVTILGYSLRCIFFTSTLGGQLTLELLTSITRWCLIPTLDLFCLFLESSCSFCLVSLLCRTHWLRMWSSLAIKTCYTLTIL